MALGDYDVKPFTGPTQIGPDLPRQVRGNDNTLRQKFVDHQADATSHNQSGPIADRPATAAIGATWYATDSGAESLSLYTGSGWVNLATPGTTPSGSGTAGRLSKWSSTHSLTDSLLTESGSTVSMAGTFSATTLQGTLSTAAQPNITSVGTLTSLAVAGTVTVGTTLGVSGAATLSSTLTVAGNLTASGNATLGDATTDTTTNAGVFWAQYRSNFYPSTKSDPRTGANSWGTAIPAIANALVAFGTTSSERAMLFLHAEAGTEGPLLFLGKTRGTNPGVLSAVSSGDNLGTLSMRGAGSSTAALEGFRLNARVNGTVSATSLPTDVYIATHNGTALADRWLWQAAGHYVPNATATYDIGSSTLRVNTVWSGGLNLSANLVVAGNTTLGDAGTDTLTIAPSAVTWSNNPTHSGNHTFSGTVSIAQGTATPLALSRPASGSTVNVSFANNTATLYAGMDANEAWAVGGNQDLTSSPWMTLTSALLTLPTAITAPTGTFTNFSGTMTAGAVPASLVTAGTFGAGAYTFPSTLTLGGLLTGTQAQFRVGSGTGVAITNSNTTFQTTYTPIVELAHTSAANLMFYVATGGTDEKVWDISTTASGSNFAIRARGDTTGTTNAINIVRSGTSISSITLGGATTVSGTLLSGVGAHAAGSPRATIGGGTIQLVLAENITDATQKNGRLGFAHYTNAEEPAAGLMMSATSTLNTLSIGGGTAAMNAATAVQIYTAADNTTTTGTRRAYWDSAGVFTQEGNATIGGTLGVTGAVTVTSIISARRGVSTDGTLASSITGDAINRFIVLASGALEWGDGTNPRDVNLYRNAANVLRTDDALTIGGILTVASGGAAITGAVTGGTYNGQTISSTASFTGTVTVASSLNVANLIQFSGAIANIVADTADGSDTKQLSLGGGGAASNTRGGYILLYGNENATQNGRLLLGSGNAAASDFVAQIKGITFLSVTRPASTNLLAITGESSFSSFVAVGGATLSSTTALITPASTTGVSSLRIPHGTAPSSPTNGDVWTTTSGAFARINGATVGPFIDATASITGSAATLTTTRTIWGQNFNGSANVSGAMTGVTTLTMSGDLRVNATISTNIAPNPSVGAYFVFTALTSASPDAMLVFPTFPSTATIRATGVHVALRTATASFTLIDARSMWIDTPQVGSGSAITTAYGLYISSQSSAATNYAIYTNTGLVRFGDVVGVGGATPSTATALITPASTTSISSLRIPHGTAPSSPTDGDYWTDTGSAKVRINGVTQYASWAQQAAVADATGAGDIVAQFNDLLAKLRTINIIAT